MRPVIAMLVLILLGAGPLAHAAMRTQAVDYKFDGKPMQGVLVWDDAVKTLRPGVLMVPDWTGINPVNIQFAKQIAGRDYVIFMADMYGKDVRPKDTRQAQAATKPLLADRLLLRQRVEGAFNVLKLYAVSQTVPIDGTRLAAIGFCFGGTSVLDLARSGSDVAAVVSFHGGLGSDDPSLAKNIKAWVLALNGADDAGTMPDAPVQAAAPGHCVVVGAGLAGASVAYSLAQRGWRVTVLDQADEPATGASGLPAGVVAPHVSPDDRPVSRLTRAGARATLARAAALLQDGVDFAATGVLERHAPGERRLPVEWLAALANAAPTPPAQATAPESWPDTDPRTQQRAQAASVPLDEHHRALWHAHAGWLRPAALVRAMLGAPGITWVGRAKVTGLRAVAPRWQVLGESASAPGAVALAQALPTPDANEARAPAPVANPAAATGTAPLHPTAAGRQDTIATVLAEADLVFVTAGFGTLGVLGAAGDGTALPLHALRGQVAWGPMPLAGDFGDFGDASAAGLVDAAALPPFPVNGHGSLIGHVPTDTGAPLWVTGSTFERGQAQAVLRDEDHAHNRTRLAELLPAAAKVLDAQWADGRARPWAGVRATLPDRLPAVGAWATGMALETESNPPPAQQPPAPAAINSAANQSLLPVHVLTGLGARGLTLAVLCGEIAAAWLHDEPLPVEATLARKLRAGRFGGSD